MPWKLTLHLANLVAASLLLLLHWRGSSEVRDAKDRGDGRVEFSRDPLTYLVWPLIVLLPAWIAFHDLQKGSPKSWTVIAPALIILAAAAGLFKFPGTIVVAHDAIEQHFWLRGEKRIRWEEISLIKGSRTSGNLIITASDGTKIVYSDQLADRPRFYEELEKHAHGHLPSDGRPGTLLSLQGGR